MNDQLEPAGDPILDVALDRLMTHKAERAAETAPTLETVLARAGSRRPGVVARLALVVALGALAVAAAAGLGLGALGSRAPIGAISSPASSPSPTPPISEAAAAAVALANANRGSTVVSTTLSTFGADGAGSVVAPDTLVWSVRLAGSFPPVSCGGISNTPYTCPPPATTELILIDARTGAFIQGRIPAPPGPTVVPSAAPSPSPASNTAAGFAWQAISISGSSSLEIETLVGLPDGYLAVAQGIGDPAKVSFWRSSDGIGWHELPTSAAFSEQEADWSDSVASLTEPSPGHLVAVGSANNGDDSAFDAVAWTSSDNGLTWHRSAVAGASDAAMSDVTATSNGLIAVGVDGHPSGGTQLIGIRGAAVWTSLDGSHWARTPTQPSFGGAQMDHVIAVGPVAIATGLDVPTGSGSGAPPIWRSVDGLTWTRAAAVSPTPLSLGADAAVWTGSSFVVSGTEVLGDGRYIWTSSAGLSWSEAPLPAIQGSPAPSLAGLALAGSAILLVGTPSGGGQVLLWESSNGQSWQAIQTPSIMAGGAPLRIVSGPAGLLIVNSNTHGTTGWLGSR